MIQQIIFHLNIGCFSPNPRDHKLGCYPNVPVLNFGFFFFRSKCHASSGEPFLPSRTVDSIDQCLDQFNFGMAQSVLVGDFISLSLPKNKV